MAESVKRYDTGEFAVMNCAASAYHPQSQTSVIAVGHNEKCQLYRCQLARELLEDPGEKKTNGVIHRRGSTNSSPQEDLKTRLTFQVSHGKAVQTDFR